MPDQNITQVISRKIASLPTNAYRFVMPTGNDHEVDIATANKPFYGVLTELPRAAGDSVNIAVAGLIPVEVAGAINDGDPIKIDSVGRAAPVALASATSLNIAAFAYGASSNAGDIISVMPVRDRKV